MEDERGAFASILVPLDGSALAEGLVRVPTVGTEDTVRWTDGVHETAVRSSRHSRVTTAGSG
jgi:hypothetical protein